MNLARRWRLWTSRWLPHRLRAAKAPTPQDEPRPLAPAQSASASAAATAGATASAAAWTETSAMRAGFIGWLLDVPAASVRGSAAAAGDIEAVSLQALKRLDIVIASQALSSQLLPRAPDVVPKLMQALRDDRYSSVDVARRIEGDVLLAAEVVRLASGIAQRGTAAASEAPDLARAVALVGADGLRRAISRVVLRPLFDVRGTSLSARAASRIWQDADNKARLCAALAVGSPVDPLDAYVAALLHGTGWSAALRAIDAAPEPPDAAALAHPALADAWFQRRDRLYAMLAQHWQVGEAVAAAADEIGRLGLAEARLPLSLLLRQAQALALVHLLNGGQHGGLGIEPPADLAPAVLGVYRGLSQH